MCSQLRKQPHPNTGHSGRKEGRHRTSYWRRSARCSQLRKHLLPNAGHLGRQEGRHHTSCWRRSALCRRWGHSCSRHIHRGSSVKYRWWKLRRMFRSRSCQQCSCPRHLTREAGCRLRHSSSRWWRRRWWWKLRRPSHPMSCPRRMWLSNLCKSLWLHPTSFLCHNCQLFGLRRLSHSKPSAMCRLRGLCKQLHPIPSGRRNCPPSAGCSRRNHRKPSAPCRCWSRLCRLPHPSTCPRHR